jgi:hypothetical protein
MSPLLLPPHQRIQHGNKRRTDGAREDAGPYLGGGREREIQGKHILAGRIATKVVQPARAAMQRQEDAAKADAAQERAHFHPLNLKPASAARSGLQVNDGASI